MAADEPLNNFFYVGSRYIYAKKKEFLSEDAVNVSTDEKDATKCCPNSKKNSETYQSTHNKVSIAV